ncbi:unnamed protein product [Chrysoparadoxa australica]
MIGYQVPASFNPGITTAHPSVNPTTNMKTTCVALAGVASASAFVAPSAPLNAAPRSSSTLDMVSTKKSDFGGGGGGGFLSNLFAPKEELSEYEMYFTKPEEYANIPDSTPTTERLIGEEMVTDDASASALADRCIAEAERLFDSNEGWSKELLEDGVYVESKDLHGEYGKSGVRIVRGVGQIDANHKTFYDYQVSREGFQCIDEYLENHANVAKYNWNSEGRPHLKRDEDYELMMNRVEWAYPTQTREFVALDIIDREKQILISKSALHPDRPGGSRYQDHVEKDEEEFVRSVQYYASRVEPLPSEDGKERCLLRMVTWGEMCDSYSAWWINKFNANVFITPKYDRFRRAMGGEKVFELSNIVNEAWKLPKMLMVKPDSDPSATSSDFVTKMMEVKGKKTGKIIGQESK